MLYVVTGANGAGKTVHTLKMVREMQLAENRPVCHNGRSRINPNGVLSDWKLIDFKNWQDEPDGTIFFIDECHNELPVSAPKDLPEHIRMLAEHRARGFDFFLITQHPGNINSFVRKLVGPPGWHSHYLNVFGTRRTQRKQWGAVNLNCEKPGSGSTGTVTSVSFPKDAATWYTSTSLDTTKRSIPKMVWVLLFAFLLIPILGYFGYKSLTARHFENKPALVSQSSTPLTPAGYVEKGGAKTMTVGEYLDSRKARIQDFPHTAPVYDAVTAPAVAPYPAACMTMGDRCDCFTQQATIMRIEKETCLQIVKRGFFVDWQPPQQQQPQQPQQQPQQQQQVAREVPIPEPIYQQPGQMGMRDLTGALGIRNPAFLGDKRGPG